MLKDKGPLEMFKDGNYKIHQMDKVFRNWK